MGGPSAEYAVSLNTGKMVLKNLDPEKYQAKPLLIKKTGEWSISLRRLKSNFDIVFIAMHGEYGEDGTVQVLLDKYRIRYTGSRAEASTVGMDKIKSFASFKKAGLEIPAYEITKSRMANPVLNVPLAVKPADRGSSVGLSIIENENEIEKSLKLAFRYSKKVIVQKYVKGREFTCGIVEINGKPVALPVTEIIPLKRKFFDYYSKYSKGASKEITPAEIQKSDALKIQEAALKAHKAIGASGYSRSDFIWGENGRLYILEINTLPGLTKTSLLPQAAKVIGISFPKLLDLIIESGIKTK